MRFQDRSHAGRELAKLLTHYRDENPIVIALPRGGVVVGYEVARALGASLDIIVARKLGAPGWPEVGVGAIAPGVVLIDTQTVQMFGLSREKMKQVESHERAEMERRIRRYRGEDLMPDVQGRVVILVDDGIATGVTARAAIRALRQVGPKRIVLAVPVCARGTVTLLREEVDDFITIATPANFIAVSVWYQDFGQTTDEEVLALLRRARREMASKGDGKA